MKQMIESRLMKNIYRANGDGNIGRGLLPRMFSSSRFLKRRNNVMRRIRGLS